MGNGGAAANASHFAADLGKGTLGRRYEGEKRVRVTSLTDNATSLSAYANDLSFEDIFVQQLRNLLNPGDLVIAITGSGNSPNVLEAIEYAKKKGALTIGFLGFKTGGESGQTGGSCYHYSERPLWNNRGYLYGTPPSYYRLPDET